MYAFTHTDPDLYNGYVVDGVMFLLDKTYLGKLANSCVRFRVVYAGLLNQIIMILFTTTGYPQSEPDRGIINTTIPIALILILIS